jgi:cytochrome bd-type quinol oxidase subunit 2
LILCGILIRFVKGSKNKNQPSKIQAPMKQKLIHVARYSASISLLGSIAAGAVYAATSAPTIVGSGQPSELGSALFCPIDNWMFFVLLAVAVIMLLWAAYTYVTAGDDTEKVHRATKTITYAAVAVVVALVAKGFPYLVMSIFPGGSVTSPLQCS